MVTLFSFRSPGLLLLYMQSRYPAMKHKAQAIKSIKFTK